MIKYSAEETLKYIAEIILCYLDELKEVGDNESEQFMYGEKTAYVECLEMLQFWEKAHECGLGFTVESKYPL